MKKTKIRGVRWGRVISTLAMVGMSVYFAIHIDNYIFADAVEDKEDNYTITATSENSDDNFQYYQQASLVSISADGSIKFVDNNNKQESELSLEDISSLDMAKATTFITNMLAQNTFVVEYTDKNKGEIRIGDNTLTAMLIQKGYAK